MRRKTIAGAAVLAVLVIAFAIWHRHGRKSTVAETVARVFPHTFHCTVYYTPRESGFRADAGFDTTPETRPGLHGQKFGRDFLLAVEKEGFGKLAAAFQGKQYIRYWSGGWGFADMPIDNRQRPLVAKSSCAVSGGQRLLAREARFKISAASAPRDFGEIEWMVADTGSGLKETQIDLYWGEDDPLGPKEKMSRPKSAPFDLSDTTVSVFK